MASSDIAGRSRVSRPEAPGLFELLHAFGEQARVALGTRGVVLAAGGFSANAELRKAYIPFAEHHVSILPYTNTGDGIAVGQVHFSWSGFRKALRSD